MRARQHVRANQCFFCWVCCWSVTSAGRRFISCSSKRSKQCHPLALEGDWQGLVLVLEKHDALFCSFQSELSMGLRIQDIQLVIRHDRPTIEQPCSELLPQNSTGNLVKCFHCGEP